MNTLQKILEFRLISLSSFELSVFEVLEVVLILAVARVLIAIFARFVNRRLSKMGLNDTGRRFAVVQIARYVIYFIALVTSLQIIGFQPSYLLAGSAALFVGLGLGLQSTFNDFMGGLILLFEGSLEVGDVVEVNGLVGRVKTIGMRTTQILTRDAITVIIPNSKFTSENVINWSHNDDAIRFIIKVGVAYGSDAGVVMDLLKKATENHPRVLQEPVPEARLSNFGDSSLDFELLFWTREPFAVEFTKGDLRKRVLELFKEHGIRIPFPQRDIHLFQGGEPS